jgi:hypothetical protein
MKTDAAVAKRAAAPASLDAWAPTPSAAASGWCACGALWRLQVSALRDAEQSGGEGDLNVTLPPAEPRRYHTNAAETVA